MLLRDWRFERKLSLGAVAKRVAEATGRKTNAAVVHRWERGAQIPRRLEMVALYLLSGGQVTPNDFYALPALPERQEKAA